MGKNSIIILILFASLNGCKPSKPNSGKEEILHYQIDLQKSPVEAILSNFVIGYKYTPLETSPDCLMGWIKKVIISDSVYYVFDSSKRGRILIFSKEGKYLNKIERAGKGPGEYVGIRDFEISSDKSKIYILTETDGILIYNCDGSFVNSLKLKSLPESMSLWNFLIVEDALVFNVTTMSGNSYLSTDLDGKLLSIRELVPGIAYVSDQMSKGFPRPTYLKRICDTVFRIDPRGRLLPSLHLDFMEQTITIKEWEKSPRSDNGWSKKISHEYARLNQFYDLKDVFILQFNVNTELEEKPRILFGSHSEKSCFVGGQLNFNDYFDLALIFPLATVAEENTICTPIYPHLMHEALKKYHQRNDGRFHVIDSLCNITTMDDNPILAFYQLAIKN